MFNDLFKRRKLSAHDIDFNEVPVKIGMTMKQKGWVDMNNPKHVFSIDFGEYPFGKPKNKKESMMQLNEWEDRESQVRQHFWDMHNDRFHHGKAVHREQFDLKNPFDKKRARNPLEFDKFNG